IIDSPEEIEDKVEYLISLIKSSSCVVVYCGAGISTASGIPDFRGPNGVWTLEKQNAKQSPTEGSPSFEEAKPNYAHFALLSLAKSNFIHFIVSQNIDGLFLKAGASRKYLCELHGNFFLDECNQCFTRYVRKTTSPTMGLKISNMPCPRVGRPCRGFLRDTILDWEDELPIGEIKLANQYSQKADLAICLGTSLQIVPAANMPFICKKRKTNQGKVAIVNLQPTKFDSKADLVIHDYVNNVLMKICKSLNVEVPTYSEQTDITKYSQAFKKWI
ncbi:NAD-dependent protein deacetylase sirtuin-6-like protein, partial [Dinothrombium tinctorium]